MRSDSANCRRLMVLLVLVSACRKSAEHESDDEKTGPKKVRCASAPVGEVSDTIDVRGTVAPLPDRDAQVSAEVGGRLPIVLVRRGVRVESGALDAQIGRPPLQAG